MPNAVGKRLYCPRCNSDFWAHLTVSPRGFWCSKCPARFTARTDSEQVNVIYRVEGEPAESANHYDLLGVKPGAGLSEIKAAYRRKANKWHPDKNAGSAEAVERFRDITEAYSGLIDEEKRSAYDSLNQTSIPRDDAVKEKRSAYDSVYQTAIPKDDAKNDAEVKIEIETTQAYVNEMIQMALQLKSTGLIWADVVKKMVLEGCPFELARQIALGLRRQRQKAARDQASELGVKAAISIGIGIAISLLTANLSSGRFILLFYFPYLYGVINGCRALYYQAISYASE